MEQQENKQSTLREILTLPFLVITVLSGLMTVCLQMTVSAMPLFVVSLGVAKSLAGSATTACTLASLFFRPFSARITDRMGGKKPAIFGMLLYSVLFFAYQFCSSMPLVLCLRLLQGIGMSLITTALGAVATQMVPKDQMTRGMSYYSLGNATALCIGPALGLELVNHFDFAGLFIFGMTAALVGVALMLIIKLDNPVEPDNYGKEKPEIPEKLSFFRAAVVSGSIFPSALMALMILCQTSLSTYLSFFGKSIGLESVSIFFTLNVFGMILSKFFLGKACDLLGNRKVGIACGMLLGGSFLVVSAIGLTGQTGLILAGLMYGFGYGGFYTLLNVAAVKNCDRRYMGVANSLFFGSKDIGTSVGSLAWGAVTFLSYQAMYLISAVVIVVLTVLFVFHSRN